MNESAPSYRIELFQSARARLKQCAREARRLGIAKEYAAALRAIQENLSVMPLSWGDPVKHFKAAKLWKYQQLYDRLLIVYIVREQERIVYIQDVIPVLGHPLES